MSKQLEKIKQLIEKRETARIGGGEKAIKPPHSPFVIRTLQEAGRACKDPWHYACLMAVCDDHGLLIDRTCYTDFARTLVAWGIVGFTAEKAIGQLANSIRFTACQLPRSYRSWGSEWKRERDKCESLASCFGQGMREKKTLNPSCVS